MKLYNANLSPFAARVRIQVYAKGLDVEILEPPHGTKSLEYREINPLGRIPALSLDGFSLPESETIVEYLEDRFPAPSLRPDTPEDKARARLVGRLVDAYVVPPLMHLIGQMRAASREGTEAEAALSELNGALSQLDRFVSGGTYAVGDKLTTADCMAVPLLFFVTAITPAFNVKEPFLDAPKLKSYFAAAANDPNVARVLEEMGQALAAYRASEAS